MNRDVAFLGLGVMGGPMAMHLARAGHRVTVYNRTREKAEALKSAVTTIVITDTPAQAASSSDFVVMCLGNDDDVRDVVLGDHGALAGSRPGTVMIDHTTTSAELARELAAACAQRGVAFLDAPVSGGQVGAQNGALTAMVGGDAQTFDRAQPILSCYTKKAALLGAHGSGQLAKMVNQICIAGLLQGLAEGLNFARAAGLDAHAVIDVIRHGAAQSWQMEQRHQTMLEGRFDFGFAVDWMRKDLGIALHEASKHNAPLPVTALVDSFYAEVQSMGGNRWDTSSLIKRLEKSQA